MGFGIGGALCDFREKKGGSHAQNGQDLPTKYNRLVVAGVGGLALLLVGSQSWAGSSGPGWASRLNGAQAPAAAKTYYTYCYAGDAPTHTAYFSAVITSAPAVDTHDLKGKSEASFDTYLKTVGARNSGALCIPNVVSANTMLGKKQREAELVSEKWKIVETNWTGNQ